LVNPPPEQRGGNHTAYTGKSYYRKIKIAVSNPLGGAAFPFGLRRAYYILVARVYCVITIPIGNPYLPDNRFGAGNGLVQCFGRGAVLTGGLPDTNALVIVIRAYRPPYKPFVGDIRGLAVQRGIDAG